MSTKLQRRIYAGCAMTVVSLVFYAAGEAHAVNHPTIRTVTQTKVQVVKTQVVVPGPTKNVPVDRLSKGCRAYLADSDELLKEFATFTNAYGQVGDELNKAFAAIETKDESNLNLSRIKLGNIDSTASDAESKIIQLLTTTQADRQTCKQL